MQISKEDENKKIFKSLDINVEYIKTKYNLLINSDIVCRNFTLNARGKQYKAAILYIDGMVDTNLLNDFILKPLMLRNENNLFEGNQNKVVSEAISNNITVMKKIFLGLAAALMLTACNENRQPEAMTSVDSASVVTDLMMSRRSIRAYKDSVISRDTLNEILKCGIHAPNGQNLQSYEIRVIDSPALIDSITQAVVKDNPKIAERKGFKNIFVNAPCVVCIAYDTTYDMAQIDCGLLGENIILAAWSRGIGSCCLGSSARWILDSPSAKPYLDRMAFSKNYKLLYCIALGYPDESPEAKPRRQDMIKFMD